MIQEEKFKLSNSGSKKIIITVVVGVLLIALGVILMLNNTGSHGHGAEHAEAAHHGSKWARLWANLWLNNVYFTGIALIAVFFLAVQYVAKAGWATSILRIPEAFGSWLPYAGALMLLLFFVVKHDVFHWTHHELYDPKSPEYDKIIAGKSGYLNTPFFLIRMAAYFLLWYMMYRLLRSASLKQDLEGSLEYYKKSVRFSAIFLIIFAVTSSTSAWDWVMSIDTHWYSTMFGWYVFASWFVTGLSAITLTVILLKQRGYLSFVTSDHLHDLGKFMFAFSIFWTYIWFSQFMLIYYANLPEEVIYFEDRLINFGSTYGGAFFINLFINFLFPFLVLMTREAKRQMLILKIVAIALLFGHWLDFYLMVMPGTLKGQAGFGPIEIGCYMVFAGLFTFVMTKALSKAALIPKHHPMLEESLHHHI